MKIETLLKHKRFTELCDKCDTTPARVRQALKDEETKGRSFNILRVMDTALDSHGVEYVRSRHDTMQGPRGFDYLNMGDTYDLTVIHCHRKEEWFLTDWGSIVEASPSFYE